VKKLWQTSWRLALCALLLAWVFHSIFVHEARLKQGEAEFAKLPRTEQWKQGWQTGPRELGSKLAKVAPAYFGVSLIFMGATLLLGMLRWRLALKAQGLEVSWRRIVQVSFVAHFFNSVLLGSNGGDLIKAWYAARDSHHKKTEAVLTVVVDRLIGLWAMLLFACGMMVFNLQWLLKDSWTRLLTGVVVLMMIGGTVVLGTAFWGGISRRWSGARAWLRRMPKGAWLESTLDSCRQFGRSRGFVPKSLAVSMLLNLACVAQFQVLAMGMNLSINPVVMLVAVPLVICISALPITPNGLGVRENLFVQMLAAIGVDPATALSLSLLAYAGSLLWSLVGGVVYLMMKDRRQLSDLELEASREV
jgi:glycosyltransferase 2 family protein